MTSMILRVLGYFLPDANDPEAVNPVVLER